MERFNVECTSRTSDLVDSKQEWRLPKDPYYDQEAEDKDVKKDEDVKKNKQRQTYVKRVIVHPSFKNISFREAEKIMEQMDQGEVIVRPSSKVREMRSYDFSLLATNLFVLWTVVLKFKTLNEIIFRVRII